MKSRIITTDKQIRKIVEREAKKQLAEYEQKDFSRVAYQAMAVVMCVLNREFGFGRKRLQKLKDKTEDEFMLMTKGILGRSYNANDCIEFVKKEYGIDFEQSQY